MSDRSVITISFIAFLLLFAGVGIYSATRKENTTTDYLLADRKVNFWLTALSAFATAHGGLMFTGMIGFTYQVGISAIWLPVGWVVGDTLTWLFVYKRLRIASEEGDYDTVGGFLASHGKGSRAIAVMSALVTLNLTKLGTLTATAIILCIALAGNTNVFALGSLGWSTLGASLGPLLVVRVFRLPLNTSVAIAMMALGIVTSLIWRFGLNLSDNVIETLPAMVATVSLYAIYWGYTAWWKPQKH